MSKRSVVSSRKLRVKAAEAGMTLREVNEAAELGNSYIYRIPGKDNVMLSTINKIAAVLGCTGADLLEDVKEPRNNQVYAPGVESVVPVMQ